MPLHDFLPAIPERPPRKATVLPGLALSRVLKWQGLTLPLFVLVVFSLIPLMILSTDRDAMLSVWETETATGQVSQLADGRICQGDSVEVRYSFTAHQTDYHGVNTVCSQSAYATLRAGDTVPVIYLADDPSVNAIAGASQNGPPVGVFLLFPLFGLLFFMPLYWPRISQVLRDRRLFKKGVLASGTVVFVTKHNDVSWPGWPGSTRSDVHISIGEAGRGNTEVRARCSNDWLLYHLSPGTAVTVVYDPKRSRAMLVENYIR
ncbi:hypothetical protein [Endothiovibrio diazotrophicus]